MEKLNSKQIKANLLEIMKYFIKVCDENNIKYFIAGGTCLGAVRHKGFIPWDDDIDIVVPRDDYNKLIDIFASYKDSQYRLLSGKDKDYYLPYYKLVDTKTKMSEPSVNKKYDNKFGLFIDIFPFDCVSDDKKKRDKDEKKRIFYKRLFMIKYYRVVKHKFIKNIVKFLLLPIPLKFFTHKLEKLAQKYGCGTTETYMVAVWESWVYSSKILDGTVLFPFEDTMVKIPKEYDLYLTTVYGDYMTPPPEDKRYSHGLEVYSKD